MKKLANKLQKFYNGLIWLFAGVFLFEKLEATFNGKLK